MEEGNTGEGEESVEHGGSKVFQGTKIEKVERKAQGRERGAGQEELATVKCLEDTRRSQESRKG